MAEGKKSFIAYTDWKETFDSLPDDKAGQLIKHLFAYVSDENPQTDDILINAVFANIKQQLKRDLKKWESTSSQRTEIGRLGGIKSGEARRTKTKQTKQLVKSGSKTKQTKQLVKSGSKTKQNEHDTVTDTVKEDIKKGSEIKISVPSKIDFLDIVIEEFKRLYEESNELPYAVINKGKERAATGKLLAQYKISHPDHNSNETIEGLSLYFDKVVNINDPWLRANMTLPILMSKFNEVNNILRNGKSTSNKGGSDKEFFNVVSQRLTGK